MKKSEQTQEVKERLYYLTSQFTKKYVHRYYKQFSGDIYDLITEYYIQFETPKSREKGKEQTLLDKFDPSITSLEYLVKVAVQRKLIDSSRHDCKKFVSVETRVSEFGDLMCKVFDLVSDPEEYEADVISSSDYVLLTEKFAKLSEVSKQAIIEQYSEVRDIVSNAYKALFDKLLNFTGKTQNVVRKLVVDSISVLFENSLILAPCQQITPKTVCLKINDTVYDFDRITGRSRGKSIAARISDESLEWIAENIVTYHSGISRFEF